MKRSRRLTREKWRRIMESQEANGMAAALYCREHKLGKASFYGWKRRLRGRSSEVKFVELKTVGDGADAQRTGGIEVLVGRRRVRVRRGFDRALLAEVVGVLEEMGERNDEWRTMNDERLSGFSVGGGGRCLGAAVQLRRRRGFPIN